MSDIFATDNEANHSTFKGRRFGETWDKKELETLFEVFRKGWPLRQIMEYMGRPAAGIIPKLRDRGLIWYQGGAYRYNRCAEIPNTAEPTDTESPTQSEEIQMSKANIETVVMIQGQDATTLSDDQIFSLIAKLEGEVQKLGAIQAKSKKLEAKIDGLRADIVKLCDYVDGR